MKTVDVQSVIDRGRLSAVQWIVFVLGCLIILADGLDAGAIGYIAPTITDEWGISKKELGPVFSAALVGMSFGALLSGPLADRYGRRWIVIVATALFGAATLCCLSAENLQQLSVWRFLTGLGLGAAMPNIATLLSEYMPQQRRVFMVNLMLSMFPLGAAMGGVLSAVLIDDFGWHAVLFVGGVFPLILTLLLIWMLPESIQFLLRQNKQAQAKKVAERICGQAFSADSRLSLAIQEQPSERHSTRPISMVLSAKYAVSSLMLWLCCFMSLLVFYLLVSWMPSILKNAGFGLEQYSLLTAIFPFGGVLGSIVIGWLMYKFNPNRALMWVYVSAGILLIATGVLTQSIYVLGVFIFFCGAALVGAQSSLPSLAAISYPVQCRAVGVSWMHGIGRLGAIVGAFFGTLIFSLDLQMHQIFMMLSIPVFISALALVIKHRQQQTI